jgi:hypothetical protein
MNFYCMSIIFHHTSRFDLRLTPRPRLGTIIPAYHSGNRSLQDRFDTRRLADRLEEKYLSRPIIDLAFPSYDGNGMYLSTGNLLASGHALHRLRLAATVAARRGARAPAPRGVRYRG